MDEQTLKTMPEYVQKLPKSVQDFVFDGMWEDRTKEITSKYSLNESQTDTLIDKVLFILIGLETPENFLESIISELEISRLMAEQIIEELEKRVFEYAINQIGPKIKNNREENKTSKPKISVIVDTDDDIPEIRPEIVPMAKPSLINSVAQSVGNGSRVEKREVVHTIPTTSVNTANQNKISVPKYVPAPPNLPTEDVTLNQTPKTQELSQLKPIEKPQVAPVNTITDQKKYIIDPYREPLE